MNGSTDVFYNNLNKFWMYFPIKLPVGKVAKEIGITVGTLRVWEKEGKVKSERISGEMLVIK